VWTASLAVDSVAPKGGVDMAELSEPSSNQDRNYAASKAGNWFLATEFARRLESEGIVNVTLNPGNLKTTIWDTAPIVKRMLLRPTLSPVVFGAYTNLWAGLSKEVTVKDGVAGKYIIPWGRYFVMARDDILDALNTKEEGTTEYAGRAGEFWTWCNEQTRQYA
jgi:NAD(P)-dependent dehydrogenase (short-subunit alcohol dehydrogenase family)